MTLTRWALVEKRMETVMEPRKQGNWVSAGEALRAVSDARVAGQRMALDEVREWIERLSRCAGSSGWMAALDEMEIHVEVAMDRLDNGVVIADTSGEVHDGQH